MANSADDMSDTDPASLHLLKKKIKKNQPKPKYKMLWSAQGGQTKDTGTAANKEPAEESSV